MHPATASWHLKAPSVLDQRCYKNLLWKLPVECASARWRVCTWVRVCIGCWAVGPLQHPLQFLRTGSLKAWPFPFLGPGTVVSGQFTVPLLGLLPAQCARGAEPPGPSQPGLHCRTGMVGTGGERGGPHVRLPSSRVLGREEEAEASSFSSPSRLLLTLRLALSPARSEQREASGVLGSFCGPLLPGSRGTYASGRDQSPSCRPGAGRVAAGPEAAEEPSSRERGCCLPG